MEESTKEDMSMQGGFTLYGRPIKGGSIVTGMDKLVNPKSTDQGDQVFDSSPSRDINVGSVKNEGGIQYKAVNNGNPLSDGDKA
jgi:hypothetical protein